MNNAVLIMFVYVLLYICVCTSFDGYIARSGSAGSYDMPVFNFSRYCPIVFRLVLSIYILVSSVRVLLFYFLNITIARP